MEITVDLHSHSMFAGGSGGLSTSTDSLQDNMKKANKRFLEADLNSGLKGIQILGSGDIQFSPWLDFFKKEFTEENGFLVYNKGQGELKYCLQTEIIVTAELEKKKRKSVHVIILFPDFNTIDEFKIILKKFDVKQEKLARPFVVLENNSSVSDFFHQVVDINNKIEIIPAHIMTPEGVYGGNNGVNKLEDFFGTFEKKLQIFETGLSADPEILSIIPELDNKTLLSNSDAHSSQLHRIGREFTTLDMNKLSYTDLIASLRNKKIAYSLEFPVSEGRFFLTGHRAGRKKPGVHEKDQYCFFSPEYVPKNNICPICNRKLTKGVLQRVFEICNTQGEERTIKTSKAQQKYLHGVPLTEVIASALQIKSPESITVLKHYKEIISKFDNEVNLWRMENNKVQDLLQTLPKHTPIEIKNAILDVKLDNFSFFPPGFDGTYGSLILGKKQDYFGHSVIKS
jgi:PHP family Zn ribbon phosphoesterase